MPPKAIDNDQQPAGRIAAFPTLASLRLAEGDWQALAAQGFVSTERRGAREYCKLRFRRAGKQVVRYVGGEDRALLVREELARLQAGARLARQLRRTTKRACRMLRESKRTLTPLLAANGLKFHGLAIRRPRRRSTKPPLLLLLSSHPGDQYGCPA